MSTVELVIFIFVLLLSVMSLLISFFQFKEKGFVFNNAYLYASKKQRAKMNKKPYYRQSAITFCAMGVMFILSALLIATGWNALFFIIIGLSVLLVVYAIISSVLIEKNRK